MADSPIFEFFNKHPIFPVFVLSTNTLAFLPIITLLYISQVAPLHNNCRYILSLWAISFGAVFSVNSALATVDLENGLKFMPRNMFEPHVRFQLYNGHVACTTFCSTFEILLSVERMIAVTYPTQYHFSRFAWKTLGILTTAMMVHAYGITRLTHNEDMMLQLIGFIILTLLEISVLAVKEAYEMSKAMIPVLIISYVLKASSITSIGLYHAMVAINPDYAYLTGFCQAFVLTMHMANGIFATTNLLLKHNHLRRQLYRKFPRFIYILSLWAMSFGVLFSIQCTLATVDLEGPSGFMPLNMFEPRTRFHLYQYHVMCTTFCSTFEISLSLERMIAVVHPRQYHFSGFAWKTLGLLTITMAAHAYVVDLCVHNDKILPQLIGVVILTILELSVLATGAAATKVCRVRYENMYGNSSLTARYQAKEAYEMSKAMIPVLIISYLLKASAISALGGYYAVIAINPDNSFVTGYVQVFMLTVHMTNGTFSITNLLFKHPQLRKQLIRKFRLFMNLNPAEKTSATSTTAETEIYFSIVMPGFSLFDFLNSYPILPVFAISTNTLAFIPLLCLLYISQIAPLHSNCRYILCMWTLIFGAIYAINSAIATVDLDNDSGFMPIDMFQPHIRFRLYCYHTTCTTACSIFEIALSIERMLSVMRPRQYHFSRFAWKTLSVLTISTIAGSYVIDEWVHDVEFMKCVLFQTSFTEEVALQLIGCSILIIIEISVLMTGGVAMKVCRRKYDKMYGNASLASRYQVMLGEMITLYRRAQAKEAYEITKAMIPVYILSYAIKASSIFVLGGYFAIRSAETVYLTGYAEYYILAAHAANGTISVTSLLAKHPQLRSRKFRSFFHTGKDNYRNLQSTARKSSTDVANGTDFCRYFVSMSDSTIFVFFNTHPILPSIIIPMNALAFIPLFGLLFIAQFFSFFTTSRRRYILSVWTLSFGAVFILNASLAIIDLNGETGYMPRNMFEPHIRFVVYEFYIMCTTICSSFEIALSVKRIIAIIKPRHYHFSGIAWKTLTALSMFLMGFAYVVDWCFHNVHDTPRIIGCILLAVIEVAVLLVRMRNPAGKCSQYIENIVQTGGIAWKVCRTKYEMIYGKSSLNARYQAKEAYEMSRAMIPAYITSFLLKASYIAVLTMYNSVRDTHGYLTGFAQGYTLTAHVCNGTFSMVNLLLKHPQLRRQTNRKISAIIPAPLFTFFNKYPIIANVLAYGPIIFLLCVSRVAPLHGNCRFAIPEVENRVIQVHSHCLDHRARSLFIVNIAIAILDMTNETGYMPLAFTEPPIRYACYNRYYRGTIFCSLIEIVLSLERPILFSIVRPTTYHHSGTAWKSLLAITISMVLSAKFAQNQLHSQLSMQRMLGYTVLYVIEIGVLGIGIVATKVCRNNYEKMYGNSTLTARYQAKEAYEMSRAMIPGYIISFVLKASTIAVLSAYLEMRDYTLTAYAQDYLILATVGCGAFSMVNLILKHPQLRRQSIRKLRLLLGIAVKVENRKSSVAAETDTYFTMLKESWK